MKMLPDGKFSMSIKLSEEQVFSMRAWKDPRFDRKANKITTPPTPETWERYRAAKAGLEALEAYEGTDWGGPDYGTEVHEPAPTITFEYLETVEEWLARCRALAAAEEEK